jgi:hypothetical protein
MKISTGAEKLQAKLHEVMGGPKQRFIVKELYLRCVLAVLRTFRLGVTKVGNKAKPLKYSGEGEREREKKLYLSQFRADVQTYSH